MTAGRLRLRLTLRLPLTLRPRLTLRLPPASASIGAGPLADCLGRVVASLTSISLSILIAVQEVMVVAWGSSS